MEVCSAVPDDGHVDADGGAAGGQASDCVSYFEKIGRSQSPDAISAERSHDID